MEVIVLFRDLSPFAGGQQVGATAPLADQVAVMASLTAALVSRAFSLPVALSTLATFAANFVALTGLGETDALSSDPGGVASSPFALSSLAAQTAPASAPEIAGVTVGLVIAPSIFVVLVGALCFVMRVRTKRHKRLEKYAIVTIQSPLAGAAFHQRSPLHLRHTTKQKHAAVIASAAAAAAARSPPVAQPPAFTKTAAAQPPAFTKMAAAPGSLDFSVENPLRSVRRIPLFPDADALPPAPEVDPYSSSDSDDEEMVSAAQVAPRSGDFDVVNPLHDSRRVSLLGLGSLKRSPFAMYPSAVVENGGGDSSAAAVGAASPHVRSIAPSFSMRILSAALPPSRNE
jgi:hypothetical protein